MLLDLSCCRLRAINSLGEMHMNYNFFGIPVYETNMESFDAISTEMINRITHLFETDDDIAHESQRGGSKSVYYKCNFRLHNTVDISPITDFILEHAKIYWGQLNYSKHLTPQILNTWANITPPGGNWDSHMHSPAPIAGAFYLNASPDMGNLVFEHPLETLLACQPYDFDEKPKHFDSIVEAKTGKLVLFPGWLKHKTQINNSDQTRLVIGINIGCHGTVNYIHLI